MLIYTGLRRLGGGWEVFAGPIAATIGALISHPFDAIRTRAGTPPSFRRWHGNL